MFKLMKTKNEDKDVVFLSSNNQSNNNRTDDPAQQQQMSPVNSNLDKLSNDPFPVFKPVIILYFSG